MPDNLIQNDLSLITTKILIDGEAIPQDFGVLSIYVNHEANKVSLAKIKLSDGGVSENAEFKIADSGKFTPGKTLVIQAGYDSKEKKIFEGIIIKLGMQINPNGAVILQVEGKHEAIKMTTIRYNALFKKKKDSEIINTLIQSSGLSGSIEATNIEYPEIVQHNVSNWDFALLRADLNGMMVICEEDKKLKVAKPKFSAAPVISLGFGVNILDFQAELDARNQYKKVKASSWDAKQQQLASANGNSVTSGLGGNIKASSLASVLNGQDYTLQTPSNLPQSFLDTWTTAKQTKNALAYMQGKVKFFGTELVKVGDTIELKYLSGPFNGKAFVGGVSHRIEGGSWTTEAKIGLSEAWYAETTPNIAEPESAGIIAPMRGLTIGKVTKIDPDEDGEFRVEIALPILGKDNFKVWARLSTFYASKQVGVFFYPEIGDEVIVGFLNDDPQSPIILGSVYSSKLEAPLTPSNKNEMKAIITRSKLTLSFEDEKKIITLETPAKNTIILDDDKKKISILDQNGNKIIMSDSGIQIESPKDITIKGQNIKMEAQTNIEAKGTAGVKVQGTNVEIKADVKFAAEGAMAEVKGSATTTIKGGMVMIN
ncbi:MAG: type VI secretion system tip protein VgrG [Microscillaceae bacterium]|jgi:Rhs element Vgr protein|nr:type VI secretion system tip protein VgrG [Microscillaceae bacterium]